MKTQTLIADHETVDMFRTTKDTLVRELERLAEITKDYPVVCTFAQYRFVFESKQDILDLIENIEGAVERYEAPA